MLSTKYKHKPKRNVAGADFRNVKPRGCSLLPADYKHIHIYIILRSLKNAHVFVFFMYDEMLEQ